MVKEVKENKILTEAKKRLDEKRTEKAVVLLEDKLTELSEATTIVENIEREIKDLELKITQGNF